MNFIEMLTRTHNVNGGTYRFDGVHWAETFPTTGYWVSLSGGLEEQGELTLQNVGNFVIERPGRLTGNETSFLGMWNENMVGEPESWSIDESVWLRNREDAIKLGLDNNQKAIYSCAEDIAIML